MKLNKNFIGLILISIVTIIFLGFSYKNCLAFDVSNPLAGINVPTTSLSSPEKAIESVVNIIITVSQIVFVLLFLIGGIMYLTSMGNDDATDKAKKLMLSAIIGIVIVFAAWGVGTWILENLKGSSSTTTSSTASPTGIAKGTNITDWAKLNTNIDSNTNITPTADDFTIDDSVIPSGIQTAKEKCLYESNLYYQASLTLCDLYYGENNIDTEGSRNCVNFALSEKQTRDTACNQLTN